MSGIPFEAIQAAALGQAESLLRQWLPGGHRVGREWKVGNLRGDRGDSLSINLDSGKWADFAEGVSGFDLIDLRAAITHAGDRAAAARELGELLGLMNGRQRRNGEQRGNGHACAEGWQPMVPPPAGTPRPDALLAGFARVHAYRGPDGAVLSYIGRTEARSGQRKSFTPLTYGILGGKAGWHCKAGATPRPLYGLDRLAKCPDAPVILCEGEKAADAAQELFSSHVCMTWPGGSGAVGQADWLPLAGRTVVIWPDNDAPGAKAAEAIARKLPRARILRVDDMREGGDAADIIPDDPEAWLHAHLPPDRSAELRNLLAVETWLTRDIPEPEHLLGALISRSTRMFLVGRTGLGKTLLGLALAAGMASGAGFLRWRSSRPARVLYLDGEMPADLIRGRLVEAVRRLDRPIPAGNLLVFGRDLEDAVARLFPAVGEMPPLNSDAGAAWMFRLIDAIGGVDVVFFDNVMSLLVGVQRDEEAWSAALDLVQGLTAQRIGQVWMDHTGHDSSRQYGSATKSWRFDAVGQMAPIENDQRRPGEVAFTLSFDPPGKARRRTPDNWHDFEAVTIRLADDRWTAEAAGKHRRHVGQKARLFHSAMLDALAAGRGCGQGRVKREAWLAECVRRNLIEAPADGDNCYARDRKIAPFRKAVMDLQAAGWVGADGDIFTDLTSLYTSREAA